jgi:hypothetical protein
MYKRGSSKVFDMKNRCLFVLFLPLLLLGCIDDSPKTKTLDFEDFSIEVPADWDSFKLQGYDSKVGGITNGKIVLTYDYGWYSKDFQNETAESHHRTVTTIDGKPSLIVQPIKRGIGVIGLYIEVGGPMRFNLMGRDIKDEEKVIRIFQSIRFHGS